MSTNILSLTDVTKARGARPLLNKVSVGINAGEKVAIIGANGVGKSTLMQIIAGREEPDSGTVTLRRGTRIAFGEQIPRLAPTATVSDVLEDGVRELKSAIAQYEAAATAMHDDAAALLDRIEHLGGWDYQYRIEHAAMEVGLCNLSARVETLSGGERKRAALAQLILQQPDILLLDEPTNHLDAQTIEWLEGWLRSSSMTVILVTHDRYFLDSVVDRLFELRDGSLVAYAGNYTDYLAVRAVEEAHRETTHHRQLHVLLSELEWARRSPSARTTKSKSRLDRIEAAQEEVNRLTGKPFVPQIAFGQAPRLGSTIVELDHVHMGYPNQPPLITDLTLKLCAGQRIGIIGTNGCGKSTLLKVITHELSPTRGSVKVGLNTQIAYFDQQRTLIDDLLTVRQTLTPQGGDVVHPGGGDPIHVASWLARFGFPPLSHDRPVTSLSGGERNRLSIALFLLQRANLLIFDEPTNDLDIPTLHVLEEAMASFNGCVLIVTHDRYLLDKVATAIVAFEREHLGDGAVTTLHGNYTDYHHRRLKKLQEATLAAEQKRLAAQRQQKAQTPRRAQSQKRGLTFAERLELQGIETAIEKADAAVAALEQQLNDPQLWKDPAKAHALQSAIKTATDRAAALYSRWEYLLER